MNLKRIDFAIQSYASSLDADDIARLDFFRGIWEIQQRFEDRIASMPELGYECSDAGEGAEGRADKLDQWYWSDAPILAHRAAPVDAGMLAECAEDIARYIAEHGSLDVQSTTSLKECDWKAIVTATDMQLAGSNPGSWLEQAERSCTNDAQVMVLSLALRAMIEPAQESISNTLHKRLVDEVLNHLKQTRCPVCGSEPTLAYVGPTEANGGNAQRLYCSQCGHTWEFERIRCPRCGVQSPERLHYYSVKGDDAHRLHTCEGCGGYTRTVFADPNSLAPLVPEVEDVVMATLDAVAHDGTLDQAIKDHPARTYRPYGSAGTEAQDASAS